DQYALLARRYREAPPGSDAAGEVLPDLLDRYVAALTELPKREQRAALFTVPRKWRAELAESEWRSPAPLRHCLLASERLAELTDGEQDRRAARDLRAKLADRLMRQANWTAAPETFDGPPEAPASDRARCFEGVKQWD